MDSLLLQYLPSLNKPTDTLLNLMSVESVDLVDEKRDQISEILIAEKLNVKYNKVYV